MCEARECRYTQCGMFEGTCPLVAHEQAGTLFPFLIPPPAYHHKCQHIEPLRRFLKRLNLLTFTPLKQKTSIISKGSFTLLDNHSQHCAL